MSVYKHPGSPYYHYDFQWRGRRFHGSTKCTSRREAEQVERMERERAKQDAAHAKAAAVSLRIDDVAGRYWTEVGQHRSGTNGTWHDLERLVDYFTPDKPLSEIQDDDVARLVAWRRGHRVIRSPRRKPGDCPFVSNATVNRTTTELLKRLFSRAKAAWGVKFDREPNWRVHMLSEPQERVRELVGNEGALLEAATRADYAAYFAFVRASGLRLRESLLRWSEINWEANTISTTGKGGRRVTVPITPTVRKILWPLRSHHPEYVFTYVAKRTRGRRVKGRRYPMTYSGIKTAWRRLRRRAGVKDFRFHDLRHDLATKLLRQTGNLKLVQRALNHSDIRTTLRYAHVLDTEVAAALEAVAESRNISRNKGRKAS